MRLKHALSTILEHVKAYQAGQGEYRPYWLWSSPGMGKSSGVEWIAQQLDCELILRIGCLEDPLEVKGCPYVEDSTTKYATPSWFPSHGKCIIFLDELAQAPVLTQQTMMGLALTRRMGEAVLPDGVAVIAASNRLQDKAGVNRVITPLLNRFVHLDIESNVRDWLDWATKNDIKPEVRSFIEYRPELLNTFDPTNGHRSFASERTWHFVSDLLPHLSPECRYEVLAGTVGEGEAAEFTAYMDIYEDLPPLQPILNGEKPSVDNPAVIYALIGALCDATKGPLTGDNARHVDNIAAYFTNSLPTEFAAVGIRALVNTHSDSVKKRNTVLRNPFISAWLKEHASLFTDN
jgi:hypothetical protein